MPDVALDDATAGRRLWFSSASRSRLRSAGRSDCRVRRGAVRPVGTLSLHLGSFDTHAREVSVVVGDLPAAAATVVVRLDGAEATRVPVPSGAGPIHVALSDRGDSVAVSAQAFDAAGSVIAASAQDLAIDTSRFIPAYPRVSVWWNSFVLPSQVIGLTTSGAASVTARFGGRECVETETRAHTSFKLRLPGTVPSGRTRLQVYVSNAWGVRSLSVPLWSLRWKPSTSRAILVDKSRLHPLLRRGLPHAQGLSRGDRHAGDADPRRALLARLPTPGRRPLGCPSHGAEQAEGAPALCRPGADTTSTARTSPIASAPKRVTAAFACTTAASATCRDTRTAG